MSAARSRAARSSPATTGTAQERTQGHGHAERPRRARPNSILRPPLGPYAARSGDRGLGGVARSLDEGAHLFPRLAKGSEHVGGDDVGVGGVRAPNTNADAREVAAPQLRGDRLEPV